MGGWWERREEGGGGGRDVQPELSTPLRLQPANEARSHMSERHHHHHHHPRCYPRLTSGFSFSSWLTRLSDRASGGGCAFKAVQPLPWKIYLFEIRGLWKGARNPRIFPNSAGLREQKWRKMTGGFGFGGFFF